jgi:uncharacterized protein GlcG (DUF336 family)
MKKRVFEKVMLGVLAVSAQTAWATCGDVSRDALTQAMGVASSASTGGYGLPFWVTMVDETGRVCHVATSGESGKSAGNREWLGSRLISAQKANTANAFSVDGYAISTANLYTATQPGGSLYGLQHSNPVDASTAYVGGARRYGTDTDALKGNRLGGVNVFGGGLALYKDGKKVGAIGVSGDTSCRDHANAWQIRGALGMHPAAPTVGITTSNMDTDGNSQTPLTGAEKGDELIISNDPGNYWTAWSHPACPNSTPAATTANGILLIPAVSSPPTPALAP